MQLYCSKKKKKRIDLYHYEQDYKTYVLDFIESPRVFE